MTDAVPRRRSNAVEPDSGLNYAAVGATAGPEVLAFPPEGFVASERRHRLGSGSERFARARRALLTGEFWRRAGAEVSEVHHEGGTDRVVDELAAGSRAVVVHREGRRVLGGPVRVVSLVDEPGRVALTTGTCAGNTAETEQLLLLTEDPDGAVWCTLRTMTRSTGRRLAPGAARQRALRERMEHRLLTALHPANAGA